MNGAFVFLKKEFLEQTRSMKALILISVLLLFGMTSPLLAKLMPEIVSRFPMQGLIITIPEPTAPDAYAQFFKNVSQMGVIVLLLVFSGTLSQELSKGTLTMLLAKGLSRPAVIVSKFIAAVCLWTFGYALAAAVDYGYTVYLFGSFELPGLFFSLFCLWLFGAFLLAVLILASTVSSGSYGGLLLTAAVLGIFMIANAFPQLKPWNPLTLASGNGAPLTNAGAGDVAMTVWITLILIALCLILSLMIFGKKKL
jgi:ABC-2 type transport system permease protein